MEVFKEIKNYTFGQGSGEQKFAGQFMPGKVSLSFSQVPIDLLPLSSSMISTVVQQNAFFCIVEHWMLHDWVAASTLFTANPNVFLISV